MTEKPSDTCPLACASTIWFTRFARSPCCLEVAVHVYVRVSGGRPVARHADACGAEYSEAFACCSGRPSTNNFPGKIVAVRVIESTSRGTSYCDVQH